MTLVRKEGSANQEVQEEKFSIKQKFDAYIKALQEKRTNAANDHEKYLKKYPPQGIGPHGSEEVHEYSEKILAVVELGKILGLVSNDKDEYDFLD